MNEEKLSNGIPDCPVRVWEVLLIIVGAFALIGTALVGLGTKTLTNIFTPARAEAIAKSLFDYQIPGKSQGVVGVNFGSKKIAIINSRKNPPDVSLFISKVPTEQIKDENSLNLDIALQEIYQGTFIETASTVETHELCGKDITVYIQEGKQIFSDQNQEIPAIRYMAKVTDNGVEKNVNIIANSENAKNKAAKVFDSLECRFE